MALKLTILSEQRAQLGSRASIVFGVGGGSIGRAHDNDWVLPDPERYLSAHHARVKFRDGAFHLSDTSTNGVFINERNDALGRRSTYVLCDGDRLRLGDYDITVSIDVERAEAPEASDVFPVNPQGAAGQRTPGLNDIGADLTMGDLLRPDPGSTGAARLTEDPGLMAFDRSDRSDRLRAARAASPPARAEQRTGAGDNTSDIEAFCRGAGIDAKSFAPDSHARLLHLAGLMLREALVGLKGLTLAQRDMRDHNQIEVGREDPQRIGLTGLPVEDLLLRLLQGHDAHQLDAVQWLRETLASTRRHDQAAARALRAALAEFLARLDPKVLAPAASQRTLSDAELAGLRERFLSITEMAAGELPHLFRESFARHFAADFKGNGGS
ncbi:MAG TPA: FHA domain-containing protein [Steroidobacteraceae bacterium]|jgi:predicted component of type VI protein secretion system|nr:FHA domain-containing protein [Steroidobacteraceae bacterium]